jgi:hypothetical protein
MAQIQQVTIDLSPEEAHALVTLSEVTGLSLQAVLRQGLRIYQLVQSGAAEIKDKLPPMSAMTWDEYKIFIGGMGD